MVKVFTAESSELVSEGNSLEIDNSATVVEAEISSGLLAHHHYYAELLYETQFVTLTTKIPFGECQFFIPSLVNSGKVECLCVSRSTQHPLTPLSSHEQCRREIKQVFSCLECPVHTHQPLCLSLYCQSQQPQPEPVL